MAEFIRLFFSPYSQLALIQLGSFHYIDPLKNKVANKGSSWTAVYTAERSLKTNLRLSKTPAVNSF